MDPSLNSEEAPNTIQEQTLTPVDVHERIKVVADSVSSIKRSALRFFSGTALSRVTGMVRDMVLAFAFGTHEALAALFVAIRLSSTCRRLFGEGALQSAFIPFFEELRKESSERAFHFFRDLTYLMGLFLTGFVILSIAALQVSFYFIDWSPGNREIIHLMILLMPSLFFICLFGLNISLLQCQKKYFTAGIAPAYFNLIIAFGAFFMHITRSQNANPQDAMPYVALLMVLGYIVQWLVSFLPALKILRQIIQDGIFRCIQVVSQDIKGFGKPIALGMLGAGASQINNAIDSIFARAADPEGPAQLWYSMRIQQLPLALFGIALSGALLPPLSRAIQAGRKEEYLGFLDFALRRVGALLIPCTLALYAMGTALINLIYGRGDFQAHSVLTTTGCLHGYAFGLLPMGLVIVLAPAFYANKDYATPARGAFLALFSNVFLDAFMVYVLGWKAVSVAVATSISSWINVFYLWYYLERHFGHVLSKAGQKEVVKGTILCVIAGILTWLFQSNLYTTPSFFSCFSDSPETLPTHFMSQLVSLFMPSVFFISLLVTLAWSTKANDLLGLFRLKRI